MRGIPFWIALALLLVLTSTCSTNRSTDGSARGLPRPVQPPPAGLLESIPFPDDLDPVREPSVLTLNTIPGSNHVLCSDEAHRQDLQFVVPAGPGELEWVMYRLPTNGHPAMSVQVELLMLSGRAYFGIANYNRGSWDFGPAVTEPLYSRWITPSHLSPNGNVYIVVAAWDAMTVNVISAGIVLDQPGWVVTTLAEVTQQVSGLQLFSDGPDGLPRVAALSTNYLRLYSTDTAEPAGPDDWQMVEAARATGDFSFTSPLQAEHINSRPAMFYTLNSEGYQLRYTYALTDDPGDGDWMSVSVGEPSYFPSQNLGMCEYNLRPRLVFEFALDGVWLASSPTAIPSPGSWTVSQISAGGSRPSVAVLNGRLGCSYLTGGSYSTMIRYARATEENPDGPASWVETEVWGPTSVNYFAMTSLAVTPISALDAPVVAFVATGSVNPWVHCSEVAEPAGPADWDYSLLDPSGKVNGFRMELEQVGGRPALAYCLDDARRVRFAWADTATPAGVEDWQLTTIQSEVDGGPISLTDNAGQPAVCFYDRPAFAIRYAYLE